METLDIDPSHNPNFSVDANRMTDYISYNSQDFLYAERLNFDRKAKTGVNPVRLLHEANRILKMGGILVINTCHDSTTEDTDVNGVPDQYKYTPLMAQHGFNIVKVLGEVYHLKDGTSQQPLFYYGQKVAEGFDQTRGQINSAVRPRRESNPQP